ncbi:MAG: aldo/keto reductase [Proteobacteria bacterium]|nr:MAG: aldo/keto reductase [Pseudomonadota bacterium]
MNQRRLGRTGLRVPEIGFGTMTFGSMADEATSLAILDKGLDAGLFFLDLAEVYPVPPNPEWATRTEQIVGKWMQGRRRDALILATKIAGPSGGWFQAPVRDGNTALDRHSIARACDESLRRLGTDYIDLYQTHWPDPGLPYEETMEGLTRLVEEGKVRAVGCSNESAYGLMKSLWISDKHGFARHETIQNNFSLLNRRFEDELAEVCRREQVSLLAYSPLAGGVLSGKYQGGNWPKGARFTWYKDFSPRTQVMTQRFVNERTLAATERYRKVAADCGMSIVTFAIAWTLTRDFLGSTLIGATHPDQLDDVIAAAGAKLPPDALLEVDKISREIRHPMG